jgi:hypothetical protein
VVVHIPHFKFIFACICLCVRNAIDILFLKSIDMGMVAAEGPDFYKLHYNAPDTTPRVTYITKLYRNELHIIAPVSRMREELFSQFVEWTKKNETRH